ncbi:hypothetical protein V493_02174 [Pseudogymnoascus sp. VKM F-4281 (FW-2241)]|nr:hypothetical protein V493_02174 [Pseudogymnoascus sp. VKM F-4281 (FW-2241)]
MAKRKTTSTGDEAGEERVVRRSTRVRTEAVKEERGVEVKNARSVKGGKAGKAAVKGSPVKVKDEVEDGDEEEEEEGEKPTTTTTTADDQPQERQYWLMKAEPESRLEKGHDVKFSIDDLAAKTEPEGWDDRNPQLRSSKQPPRDEEGGFSILLSF